MLFLFSFSLFNTCICLLSTVDLIAEAEAHNLKCVFTLFMVFSVMQIINRGDEIFGI